MDNEQIISLLEELLIVDSFLIHEKKEYKKKRKKIKKLINTLKNNQYDNIIREEILKEGDFN